jgi:hypothetical protein
MVFYKFTATLFLLFAAACCFAQGYTIKGHVKGVESGWAYILHRQRVGTDSGKIVSGNFIITGKVEDPEFCTFGLAVKGKKGYYLTLFLAPNKLTLSADAASLNDLGIYMTGSRVELEFQQFQAMVAETNKQHLTELRLAEKLEQLASSYALQHRSSYISAFAIFSYVKNPGKLLKLFNVLSPPVRYSYFGQKAAQELNSR